MNSADLETRAPEAGGAGVQDAVRLLAGKYITFRLAREVYGIEVLKVRELIRVMEITRVPGTKAFVRGVINLRGRVIPVVDPRLKFAMGEVTVGDQTVIIVVQYEADGEELTMGILVDEVLEVSSIAAENIEPPPDFGAGAIDTAFILGVGKAAKQVVLLLDISGVLSAEEQEQVSRVATGE
ncbi:MAG: purine-binding chemotaxis protein CheW [Deltaproteobacteria bacterium]|nr:purine-binding chemotaxis protein CheW [Deltaproteobacteria bacterium]